MATWAPSSAPRYLRTYQRKTTIVLLVLIAINLNAVKCKFTHLIKLVSLPLAVFYIVFFFGGEFELKVKVRQQ